MWLRKLQPQLHLSEVWGPSDMYEVLISIQMSNITEFTLCPVCCFSTFTQHFCGDLWPHHWLTE